MPYTDEHSQAWHATLLPLQQDLLCQTSIASLAPTTPKDAWEKKQVTPFLLACLQALDSTRPPRLVDIAQYLAWYADLPAEDPSDLAWLFLTKCTLAVYAQRMDILLQGSLPLSQALSYWNNTYGNAWLEIYYGLQSLPRRLVSLAHHTKQAVQKQESLSMAHYVGAMFPLLGHASPSSSPRALSSPHAPLSSSSSPAVALKKPSAALFHVFRHLYHMPLPMALLRDEIQQKRAHVRSLRKHQASLLGLLIKVAPTGCNNGTATLQSIDQAIAASHRCLQALTISSEQASHLTSTSINEIGIDAIAQSITGGVNAMAHMTPVAFAQQLDAVVQQQLGNTDDAWQQLYGTPTRLERYWVPGLVCFVGGRAALSYVMHHKDEIIQWTRDAGETIRQFLVHWVWEPTLQVLDTIRFQDRRIGLSSKEGLKTDMDSLERMVLEFAKHNQKLPDADLAALVTKVRDGDVSVVLRAYENEIKNPLRNAIRGDLIQTLLIQVQKTKVDVELAMQALDKLLKSNELNFAFLAVAPSMLLTYGAVSYLRGWYDTRTGKRAAPRITTLRDALRRIDRLLTLDQHEVELNCESQGQLLCELLLLRNEARYLPRRQGIRESFLEDVRDLEARQLNKIQKKETILRMYRSWSFLK